MIKARIPPENPDAILNSYSQVYQSFSWRDIESEFTWHGTGEINVAHEAIDRWARDRDKRDRKALIFEKAGNVKEFSFLELRELSSQWANLLIEHGFSVGDRLFIFLPSCPETYLAILACARLGVIFSPLYPSLGFDELEIRLQNAKPRGIITHPDLLERLPEHAMGSVEHVFLTEGPGLGLFPNEIVVRGVVETLPKKSNIRWVRGTTPLYLIYTSGSTGPPKGVVHAHMDMLGHMITARYVLNLSEGTVLWTDGDPSWVTGTVYGAFAPWLCGATSVIQGDQFSASTWYRTLERHKVAVWYTTPRTMTRLAEAGDDLPGRYDFSHLKHIATVGETLSPEQFYWAKQTLRRAPHDTWWMTETGMICLANFQSSSIKPGSMGKPVPGIEAAVLDENGELAPILTMGELALRPGWPSMMTGIWQDAPRYQAYFRFKDWFLTGDMVTKDEEGYYYHQGRNDDLIKLGEKFIGPYEIEHILSLHPAVAEAVVISQGAIGGKTSVKGFLTLNKGYMASARLNHEIKTFVKANFSPDLPLAEIVFLEELPKTRSGKILRRVLRAREKGLPSGDTAKLKE
ncbi:MAG: AMP-binding protein [Desulfomonile tiedjei]|uniref:acetate--CoA ligase n=1 Tax=Desulfomonile tiedjei TaxID=2358 RepID=A0A9D6Z473_9BACT|nr:AMP-binding protein [Desulfomonile tiedjei]